MTTKLVIHLEDLVVRLGDLRRRLKEAARYEVAQAISETLTTATRLLICGPTQPRHYQDAARDWDDPWVADGAAGGSWEDHAGSSVSHDRSSHVATALLTGLGAARWSLCRSVQPLPAMLIGSVVACIVLVGGDRVSPLVDVCSVAQDLFLLPDRRR